MKPGINFIRFGIPSLDHLFSPKKEKREYGIPLPMGHGSTSISLIGRTGSGKSLLGLHLASRYLADAVSEGKGLCPRVFYVSTDLSSTRARDTWKDFGLDWPNQRTLPFGEHEAFRDGRERINLTLKECRFGEGNTAEAFQRRLKAKSNDLPVYFIDLSGSTAGDEWGFVLRTLSLLQQPVSDDSPRHLLILDAIEGLETFSGLVDPHGHSHNHRSRLAQMLRAAANKCHLAFVLEDSHNEPCAEEYVSDVVLRLGSTDVDGYLRRSLELVKARGSAHVRGQHHYYIRDGKGVKSDVPDDPKNLCQILLSNGKKKSRSLAYFHVIHSLHWMTRMRMQGKQPATAKPTTDYAQMETPKLGRILPENGIPRGGVTSLTGDEATYKSRFGRAFLSGGFSSRPGDKNGEAAVYITTHNLTRAQFIKRMALHCLKPGEAPARQKQLAESKCVVFRQLEAHNLNSSMLFNIIRRCIEKASQELRETVDQERWWQRTNNASKVRVVIDDWATIKCSYPQIREDALFLPFLIRYFEEKGVTVLIIETSPGRPDKIFDSESDRNLRSLVSHQLFTWHVPFFGEDRVAIAAIPPILDGFPAVIAELRPYHDPLGQENERLWGDPHFELYEGLESREPKPVSLEVQLFGSSTDFQGFQNQINAVLNKIFTAHHHNGVVQGFGPEQYTALRTYTQLIGDIKSRHSSVIQVDEYWQPSAQGSKADHLAGVKKVRKASPKTHISYLAQPVTDDEGKPHATQDPYRQFQHEQALSSLDAGGGVPKKYIKRFPRHRFFDHKLDYGNSWHLDLGKLSLTPYLWDFGFLLLRKRAWEAARLASAAKSSLVADVWNYCTQIDRQGATGNIGWREFFEACKSVTNYQTGQDGGRIDSFDMDMLSPQTLPCLVFEVWASEMEKQSPFSHKRHNIAKLSLLKLLKKFHKELFRAWLLLGEVLAPKRLLGKDGYVVNRSASNNAAAVRHWYSTATQAQKAEDGGIMVPGRLPGNYVARGDWFLTVTSDSRSVRLGERAMDLLSRRRDNVLRLEAGIGLPVRDLLWDKNGNPVRPKSLQTCLMDLQGNPLNYTQVCKLGPSHKTTKWLWRSQISNYHRHDRIWERWVARFTARAAAWIEEVREVGLSGFQVYDDLKNTPGHAICRKALRAPRDEFDKMVLSLCQILQRTR